MAGMNKNVRYITYTAMLLALTVIFQSLRVIFPVLETTSIFGPFSLSTLIVGSLVNLCLIIAALYVGFWSGIAVSILSTVIAFFQGHLPAAIPQMILVVSIGNIVIVTVIWLLKNKNIILALACGSVAKFLALWGMVALIIVPVFSSNDKLSVLLSKLSIMFSWPQLITAIVGGLLSLLIYPRLDKSRRAD